MVAVENVKAPLRSTKIFAPEPNIAPSLLRSLKGKESVAFIVLGAPSKPTHCCLNPIAPSTYSLKP